MCGHTKSSAKKPGLRCAIGGHRCIVHNGGQYHGQVRVSCCLRAAVVHASAICNSLAGTARLCVGIGITMKCLREGAASSCCCCQERLRFLSSNCEYASSAAPKQGHVTFNFLCPRAAASSAPRGAICRHSRKQAVCSVCGQHGTMCMRGTASLLPVPMHPIAALCNVKGREHPIFYRFHPHHEHQFQTMVKLVS